MSGRLDRPDLVAALALAYRDPFIGRFPVGKLCDVYLDTSGQLLAEVREVARAAEAAERAQVEETEEEVETTLYTVGAAAAYLGVSAASLRKWADAGEVAVLRTPGNQRRFTREALDALRGRMAIS